MPHATNIAFWATICKMVCPMLMDHCLSCLSMTLTTAANNCVAVKRLGVQKSGWSEELNQLKQETIVATIKLFRGKIWGKSDSFTPT